VRIQAHAWRDGYHIPALYLNNDAHGPTPIPVRFPNGEIVPVRAEERYVLGAEGNPRDQIKEHPLLVRRYSQRGLLRGIPVFETYNRGGRGGHSIPVISAMDIDLHIEELYAFLRRGLRWLRGDIQDLQARSDLERILKEQARKQQAEAQSWIILIIGGGAGSFGNAAHQLLPYLVRSILQDMEIHNYELWGVVLGPRAFTGLTPDIAFNYRALLESLEHMAWHGQRREYINGLVIDTAVPPYDRVFLMDDPTLPAEGPVVTERELERFFDRAALSLHLLLNTGAWDVVASHAANPRAGAPAVTDHRVRWLHTVSGELAGADREGLLDLLSLTQEAKLLDEFVTRLSEGEKVPEGVTEAASHLNA